jgi:hypothetical protein
MKIFPHNCHLSSYFGFAAVLLLLAITPRSSQAQSPQGDNPQDDQGFAVGMHFAGLSLDRLDEGAAGLGARAAYDFPLNNSLIVSPEIELNHFPQVGANFGETQLLAGAKVGLRRDQVGVFAKVRPGFIHIPGNGEFAAFNGSSAADKFALDTGLVLEYWPRQRMALRFDIGDTMIYFGSPVRNGVGAPRPAGMSHNMQFGMGIMFHF